MEHWNMVDFKVPQISRKTLIDIVGPLKCPIKYFSCKSTAFTSALQRSTWCFSL